MGPCLQKSDDGWRLDAAAADRVVLSLASEYKSHQYVEACTMHASDCYHIEIYGKFKHFNTYIY